jgi:cobalt/nickel transport system permease protein
MLFAGTTVVVISLSGSILVALIALSIVVLVVTRSARISIAAFWRFLRIPAGFILIGVATLAVTGIPADGAGVLGAVSLGPWRVGFTDDSLTQALRVAAISFACVACTLSLALTTPLVDVTDQLRRWRVPSLFTEMMVLTYRFIFVFIETANTMRLAQSARLGYANRRSSFRSLGMLMANIYLRAQVRASALFTALSARGYSGELRVLIAEPKWSRRHLLAIAGIETLLIAAALGTRLGTGF